MTTERDDRHPDDAGIEDLLREVGSRQEPSAEAARSVEAAVHAQWQSMLEERRRARRRMAWGLAAGIALVMGAGILTLQLRGPDNPEVATIARIDGHLLAGPHPDELQLRIVGVPIRKGELLRTDDRSRVALALAGGVSLRMDYDTTVRFAAADSVELQSGALYIDAHGPHAVATDLTVRTGAGSVRHVGTQYQVRLRADEMSVGVREGTVLIQHGSGTSLGASGESIHVTSGGTSRSRLSSQDPSWKWVALAAPPFDIENQTLSGFLDWLARETGRRVVYATAQAEAAAQDVRLRGSIEGLELETALAAVLSTTQLRRYETDADAIGIAVAAQIDLSQ